MKKRRNHDADFKARVALEALKGKRTVSELTVEYGMHPTMIHEWKKARLNGAADIFKRDGIKPVAEVDEEMIRSLHPRSRSWLSPTIFCHESSSRGPASP